MRRQMVTTMYNNDNNPPICKASSEENEARLPGLLPSR